MLLTQEVNFQMKSKHDYDNIKQTHLLIAVIKWSLNSILCYKLCHSNYNGN